MKEISSTTPIAAAAMAARPGALWAAPHEINSVGLQLYTVRSEMPKDFEFFRKSFGVFRGLMRGRKPLAPDPRRDFE